MNWSETESMSSPVVLITGAGSGFGRALALEFNTAKWRVIALLHNPLPNPDLLPCTSSTFLTVVGDVTDESCKKVISDSVSAFGGRLTVLVNNAGNPGGHPADPIDSTQIKLLFDTHCIGSLRSSKACLPYLRANSGGWIVNISSRLGSLQRNAQREFANERRSYAYRIAKASLNMATLCMAQDDALANIQVIAIHPGQMSTKIGIPDAPHTAEESAAILVRRLVNDEFVSGHFYDLYNGEIPW